MDEQVYKHTTQIVDAAHYLLSGEGGTLTPEQVKFVHAILANAEKFVHICMEFEGATAEEISSSMRHKLGNILTPIRGYSDLLARPLAGDLNLDQQTCVELIRASTLRLYDEMRKRVALASATSS